MSTENPEQTTSTRRRRTSSPAVGERVLEEQVPREVREAADAGVASTRTLAEAQEAGYLGDPVDPRPNEDYTVAGEERRRALAAEGKSVDYPPSREQRGPARELGEQVVAGG
jgi:hypothetical protein